VPSGEEPGRRGSRRTRCQGRDKHRDRRYQEFGRTRACLNVDAYTRPPGRRRRLALCPAENRRDMSGLPKTNKSARPLSGIGEAGRLSQLLDARVRPTDMGPWSITQTLTESRISAAKNFPPTRSAHRQSSGDGMGGDHGSRRCFNLETDRGRSAGRSFAGQSKSALP